jgi:sugar phosphate isomerase/epimerase
MITQHSIYVSLSSFGAHEVKRHGQPWFTRLCHQAGADGVEVRGELRQDRAQECSELAAIVRDTGLQCVYSCPDMLWRRDGGLDLDALDGALDYAGELGAATLKMSIGAFPVTGNAGLAALAGRVGAADITLLIENDQTVDAGSLHALRRFFDASDAAQLALGMTFDVGNWHWIGECPMQAAQEFSDRVRYVHCKGVQRRPDRWIAVPLEDSIAPWRAIIRAMPRSLPLAIEYPLMGEDLLRVTTNAVRGLRELENQL